MKTVGLCVALSACSIDLPAAGDFDFQCIHATGEDNVAFFCGNEVSDHVLGLEIGTTTEVTIGAVASATTLDVTSVATGDGIIPTTMFGYNDVTMIPPELDQTELTIYDHTGAEIDQIGVEVTACDHNVGELGAATFCGDVDDHHVLSVVASMQARIRVFTPAFGRLDFHGVGASDWSTVSVSIPTTGPTGTCDPTVDYCTNVLDITGVAIGTADIGIDDANGQLIDQVTVNVIDHW